MKNLLCYLMAILMTTMANQTQPEKFTATTKGSSTTTTTTTATTSTTRKPTTTRPQSFFPPGPARNAIHNVPPHDDEMDLLEAQKDSVDTALKEWRGEVEKIPAKLDWRKLGVVTPVQDMRECSAAHAFAAVAMLESQFKIQHGELKPFSTQQIIDCIQKESSPSDGCSGRSLKSTFEYIQNTAGLLTHHDYPWDGKQGRCRFNVGKAELQVKGYLAFSGEERIRHFTWKRGPVVSYMNPALLINDYPGGVIRNDDASCDSHMSKLTHMVVIVGFGESRTGVKYWIVRNSWGPRWGYRGYFHIERGTNTCGIETLSFIANIE